MSDEQRVVEQLWYAFEAWSAMLNPAMAEEYSLRMNAAWELLKEMDRERYYETFRRGCELGRPR